MADELNAGTTQNTGTEATPSTLLTGSDATAGAKDQPTGTAPDPGKAPTDQTAKDGDGAKQDGTDKEEGSKPAPKAPEKYEFKMPEGIQLDTEAISALEPVARKLDLSQEQAQELVDLHIQTMQRQAKAAADTWSQTTKGWVDTVKTDPELGGANYDTTINSAKAALKQFGDADTIKFLDDYQMGNHPGLIRMLAKIGKAMGEDTFKTGSPAGRKSPEQVLYGSE